MVIQASSAKPWNIKENVLKYMSDFHGDVICARQVWYEGLGGQGVPFSEQVKEIEAALDSIGSFENIGDTRFEKFGVQNAYALKERRADYPTEPGKIMVHHLFKPGERYKDQDGRVFQIALSEVYNLRCFEVVNGSLTGPMIKIHPASDYAKTLAQVN